MNDSVHLLKSINETCYAPERILTEIDEVERFVEQHAHQGIDVIIYQSVTFADATFVKRVIELLPHMVIVWSVREPSVGGRLRLNSLTGGNSTCNTLKLEGRYFRFIFGNPDEQKVHERISLLLLVEQTLEKLRHIKIGLVGDHPPGFYFSGIDEEQLFKLTGTKIEHIDLFEAFAKCKQIPEAEWLPALDRAKQQVIGIKNNDESVQRFAQFFTYMQRYIEQHHIQSLAIRCWPEFFNELGAAACSTLSQFIEDGVVSSCESDILGSLSMYILRELSEGSAPYLGDMVHVNEQSNSVVFWHCGAGAYSLANPKTGAQAGVHPNRKLGMTMEFGLKPGKVTIARLGIGPQGYRLLIMKGEALDTAQRFNGTSVEVALPNDVSTTVELLMHEGFEPHYAIIYADVEQHLIEMSKRLGIEAVIA